MRDEKDKSDSREDEAPKPKRKKKRGKGVALWKKLVLTLEFLMLAAIVVAAVFLVRSGLLEESDVVFGELAADGIYYVAGQGETATFTIQAADSEKEMQLCDADGNVVGTLNDDGQDGDETARDGIYTCCLEMEGDTAGARTYHVREAKTTSNEVTIYLFPLLTAEELENACGTCDEVWSALRRIEAGYAGASGYVTAEDFPEIFSEAEAYLETLVEEGTVLRYVVEDGSAYIKFASGLSLCYEPILEDTFSGESDISLTVTCYQTVEGSYAADCAGNLDSAMSNIENLQIGETCSGEEVTLSAVKSLPADSVIVWYGHGTWSSVTGPGLLLDVTVEEETTEDPAESTAEEETAEDPAESTAEEETTEGSVESAAEEETTEGPAESAAEDGNSGSFTAEEWQDLVRDYLTTAYTEDGKLHLAVTAAYVEKYCSDLSNDLIFLSACSGGRDERLSEAFLGCGAAAVLSFSDAVLCEYASGVIDGVLQYMLRAWPESEWYYTLEQALDRVRTELGENDTVWYENYTDVPQNLEDCVPCGAEPVLATRQTEASGDDDSSGENGEGANTGGESADTESADEIRLSTEKGSLSGATYYYATSPTAAAGAAVTILQNGEWYMELTTDENGKYSVDSLPVGTYDITFSLEGYSDYCLEDVAVYRDEETTYADGYFFANGAITGSVTDALTGEALAEAEVELLIGDGEKIYRQTVWTDESGQFTFDLTEDSKSAALTEIVKYFPDASDYGDLLSGSANMLPKQLSPEGLAGYIEGIAGSGVLVIEKEGYTDETIEITVTGFDSPDVGVIELAPQVEIGGYVYDANGNALGGVSVSAVVTAVEEEETSAATDVEEEETSAATDVEEEETTAATAGEEGTAAAAAGEGAGTVSAAIGEGTGTVSTAIGEGTGAVSTATVGDTVNTATGVDGYYSLDFDMGSKLTIRVSYSLGGYETKTVDYEIDASMVSDGKVQLAGVSLSREKQVVSGTSCASSVISFEAGDPWTSWSDAMNPADALGEPDYAGNKNAVTLGAGGVLVLGFDVDFCNGDGIDIYIYEVGDDVETTLVEVSRDGESWVNVGTVDGSTSGIDLEGLVSESSTFRYIRLTDLGSHTGGWWPGADIDAVAVLYYKE